MNAVRMTPRLLGALALIAATAAPAAEPVADSAVISGLGARNIGSATMSGRIASIAGRAEDNGKVTLYVGSASGGLWRSRDSGTTFKPVFDHEPVQSIGAVALDPSNPAVVWVGTGESWTRNSVSVGDGIYRSQDGGDSWTQQGLPDSERIARIIVDPSNGNIVYACVPGKLWSDSAERGLYKTEDGGASWSLVLKGPNLSTGCSSLAMDPRKPGRLFAGLWDFRRKGWTFRSGGEGPNAPSGSGLYVTEDGGASWSRLDQTSAKGLPSGPWGRVEVVIAPSDTAIVYALIEGVRSALFRSGDGGKTWEERDRSNALVWRPFYFSRLIVDPVNPNRLYKPNFSLVASDDGGQSFSVVAPSIGNASGTHGDHHDVWINPKNPQFIVTGDDGGLWLSQDGGNKWWKSDNLPVAQFYHVAVDEQDPYQVYGGLQDNSSWVGDSAYPSGITNNRWENIGGGDGFWTFADPSDPHFAYSESQGGNLARIDRHTLEGRAIQPLAGYKEKLRYNWNAPLALSPHESGTLYIGAQFLFVTRDHGQSWTRISPDLSSNDPAKQKQEESGGITVDNSAAEMHTTIYSIAESPRHGGEIWVGTDDGNVQLTQDGGAHWRNLTPRIQGLPAASWVSWVEPGRHADGVAYAAFDRHTLGDLTPWVYRTADFGASWERIVGPGSGVRGYAHVVREDPVNARLLYVGTEHGLWISIDSGAHWAEFKGGRFPPVAVRDLAFQHRDADLAIATHGRGLWIIDDLTPLRTLSAEDLARSFTFLDGRAVQQRIEANGGWPEGDAKWRGENPQDGAVINYYQKSRHVFGRIKLEILGPDGSVVDTLPAGTRKGINRIVWSMQVKPPRVPTAAQAAGNGAQGPRVLPGVYRVRLTKGAEVYEHALEIGLDRRARFSVADRKAQYQAAMAAHALFGRMSDLADRLNGLLSMVGERRQQLPVNAARPAKALAAFGERLEAIKKRLVATKEGGAVTGEERLREHLDNAYGALLSYEGRPGDYQIERVKVLERELAEAEGDATALERELLPKLNASLAPAGLAPLNLDEALALGSRQAAIEALARLETREENGAGAHSARD